MRILFDQGTPVALREVLLGHEVSTAYERGWSTLKNGDLLDTAERSRFEVFVTTDSRLRYQQNLSNRQLAIVCLLSTSWPRIRRHVASVVAAIEAASTGTYAEVAIPHGDGQPCGQPDAPAHVLNFGHHRRGAPVTSDVGPQTGDRRARYTSHRQKGSFMASLEAHYSASGIEARILAAIRAAGLNPEQRLSPAELGALDHFHTGGLTASRELLELVHIRAEDCVLDIGAGLAGPARMLASALGCRVACLEMSSDFCAGAALLNRLTGLDDRIEVYRGSALDLPFPDDSFDVIWMQNVGMNIADKRKLYAEIYRVLKPGGRYAFQEMAAGEVATSYFPLPWATGPADSFLVSAHEMRSVLADSGFTAELFEDTSDADLSRTTANATPAAPGQLGLAVYVDNLAQKAANARRSLQEGQVRLVRGVFRRI